MQTTIFGQQTDMKKLSTAKQKVLKLLQDHRWHTTMEIIQAGGLVPYIQREGSF